MKISIYVFFLLLIVSCNKSLDSKWDIDVVVPFANTTLTINDIVEDSLISINEDHVVELQISSEALKFSFDTIASIEENSSKDFFTIPITSLDFDPGSSFPTPLEETELNIEDAELSEIHIKEGKLGLKVTSYIEERLIANFSVNSATFQGSIFQISEEFEPALGNDPSIFYNEYDISGYELDLTGINGTEFNNIISTLNVIIDPNGNSVTVSNNDSLIIEVFYLNVETAYAKGYFGNNQVNILEEESGLSFLTNIEPGQIDLQDVKLSLNVINGVGADFRFDLSMLTGINSELNSSIELEHDLIGNTVNLDRATDDNGLQSTEIQYILNSTNSNIEEWIENMPDKIEYSMNAEMNPLGNVSGGNDFIYCESEFGINFSALIPMCFSSSKIVFSDTLEISIGPDEKINEVRSGEMVVYIENTFPLEGDLQIYILQNNIVVDSMFTNSAIAGITSSFPANSGAVSILSTPVSEEKFEKIKSSDQAIISTSLGTIDNQVVKIYDDQDIKVNVVLDINYLIDSE